VITDSLLICIICLAAKLIWTDPKLPWGMSLTCAVSAATYNILLDKLSNAFPPPFWFWQQFGRWSLFWEIFWQNTMVGLSLYLLLTIWSSTRVNNNVIIWVLGKSKKLPLDWFFKIATPRLKTPRNATVSQHIHYSLGILLFRFIAFIYNVLFKFIFSFLLNCWSVIRELWGTVLSQGEWTT